MEPSRMGSSFFHFMKRNAAEIFFKICQVMSFSKWKDDRVSCLSTSSIDSYEDCM